MNYWLLLIPLLTAATGWLTLQITILFLFRPYKPRKILGFSLQGILPARQHQIAVEAGQFAAAEFSSFAAIEQKISDPGNMHKIKPLIEAHIDDFLRNKLKDQMPMISMFIGDKTINTLKTVFMNEIEDLFPQVMQQFARELKNDLNIEQMVVSKIDNISPEKLESLLHRTLAKELRFASIFGIVIGLLVGLIQMVILLLIG
jgi:uncharacterized membrane protein YheB (UPF0754 family)